MSDIVEDSSPVTHALLRTSLKGTPFVGTCFRCNAKNLPMAAALEPCPNTVGLSNDDTILKAMEV